MQLAHHLQPCFHRHSILPPNGLSAVTLRQRNFCRRNVLQPSFESADPGKQSINGAEETATTPLAGLQDHAAVAAAAAARYSPMRILMDLGRPHNLVPSAMLVLLGAWAGTGAGLPARRHAPLTCSFDLPGCYIEGAIHSQEMGI